MLQSIPIDYMLLARACNFYRDAGFEQKEVPWIVSGEVSRSTSPIPGDGFSFVLADSRHLVASGEQGFVSLALSDELQPGMRYFTVTPCFRDEELDATHSKCFMKLELFSVHSNASAAHTSSTKMLEIAREFFRLAKCYPEPRIEATLIGYDLMCGTLEVGSYGVREIGGYHMAYGTGAALPRLSLVAGNKD